MRPRKKKTYRKRTGWCTDRKILWRYRIRHRGKQALREGRFDIPWRRYRDVTCWMDYD